MRTIRILLCAAIAVVFTMCAQAQFTVGKIVFKNPGPLTEAQLLKLSGLKVGQPLSMALLQKSAQKMMDTGLFEDIDPTLDGPHKNITVLYKLQPVPASQLFKPIFENFVWFTPQELDKELSQRVPLYKLGVPESGNLTNRMRSALAQMLAQKGVHSEVTEAELEPTSAMPYSAVGFSVSIPVLLSKVNLDGVTSDFSADVQKALKPTLGLPYREVPGEDAVDITLSVYRDRGYLDATIDDLKRTPDGTSSPVNVTLSGRITPGELYHLKAIHFESTPLVPQSEFDKVNTLHPGDLALHSVIDKDVNLLRLGYMHEGYMDVVVAADEDRDPATHTVSYNMHVIPGAQYRVRNVTVKNLTASQLADFKTRWKMNKGDLYNANYVETFLVKNTAIKSLEPYNAEFHATADTRTHLVDLEIDFIPSK